jgi:hypothetical protein
VNQHAAIKEAAFSVEAATRLHNEDFKKLEMELSFGIGSCNRELRPSPGLAFGRIKAKQGIRLCKYHFMRDLK